MTTILSQVSGAVTGDTQSQGGDYTMILAMVAVFAIMYFFMIRPNQKKQKEVAKWREALKKGDKVLTAGGIYGKVKDSDGNILTLEVSKDVDIKIERGFVMRDPSDMPQK